MPLVLETKDVSQLKKKKSLLWDLTAPPLFRFLFKSTSIQLASLGAEVYATLCLHIIFSTPRRGGKKKKKRRIFSSDSPLSSWKGNTRMAVAHGTMSTSLSHSLPCKKLLPLTSHPTRKRHELWATWRSFFPASLTVIYRSPKGLETLLDPSPKYWGWR